MPLGVVVITDPVNMALNESAPPHSINYRNDVPEDFKTYSVCPLSTHGGEIF